MANTNTARIGTLPAATLAQRLAAMSDIQLAYMAQSLATRTDGDRALTAVLEVLETRLTADMFAEFTAEIFAVQS